MVINLIKIYLFFEKYRKNIKLKIYLYYIVSFVSNISSLFNSMTYNSSKYLNMGKFIQRIFDDTTVVTPLIVSMYANVLLDIFYVIAVIVIMGSMNSILTVIILILIPIFILFYKIYIPYIEKTSKDVLVIDEELKNLSEEALNGQIDIKVNNASKFINLRFKYLSKSYYEKNKISYAI